MHHGVLHVLALDGHGHIPHGLHVQRIGPGGGIGGPAQPLPGVQGGAAGDRHGQEGVNGQQGGQSRHHDGKELAVARQNVGQLSAQALVQDHQQRSGQDGADQGDGVQAVPAVKGGEVDGEGRDHSEDQGLQHGQQQPGPALGQLQNQIEDKGGHNGAAGAHAEGQHKGQGVQGQAGQIAPAGPLPLLRHRQPQGQQHAQADAPGEDVGVAVDGHHTHAGLHAAHVHIVGAEFVHQPQEGGTEKPGGQLVDTQQGGQGGAHGEHAPGPAADQALLPRLKGQDEHEHAEGADDGQKVLQSELPGYGIQGGDAVDGHEQGHGGHDPGQPLAQLLHAAQQGQGRYDQGQQGGDLNGVDGSQGGEQEQDQPGQEKGCGLEPIRRSGGIGSLLGHGVASGFQFNFSWLTNPLNRVRNKILISSRMDQFSM